MGTRPAVVPVDWAPVADPPGALAHERRARAEAERAARRASFLAEASLALAAALDPRAVLERAARLAVPTLGDWCVAHAVWNDGVRLRATAGRAGGGAARTPGGVAVPLLEGALPIGALTLGAAGSRRLTPEDLALARSFAAHVELALVSARRHAAAERACQLAVEGERRRAAAGLHDALSQVLFSIGLKLDWCRRHLAAPAAPGVGERLDEVRGDVGAAMAQMRRLIGELSPPRENAADGLGALVDQFRTLTGIRIEHAVRGDVGRLDAARAGLLRGVVQEALTNVAKHARATWARVTVEIDADEAVFEVIDDGVGPASNGSDDGVGHFGLRQMRERLEATGGRLAHGRCEPAGFRLAGALPLRG
jgi:signal transduction histidine kinase